MAEVSVEKLRSVVTKALEDEAFAERLFDSPEDVAAEQGLSADEAQVVKQMSREQFDQARNDASEFSELSDEDLDNVSGGAAATNISLTGTTANMVVGRSILSATGSSYASMTNANCDCCAWKGGVSLGDMVSLPTAR